MPNFQTPSNAIGWGLEYFGLGLVCKAHLSATLFWHINCILFEQCHRTSTVLIVMDNNPSCPATLFSRNLRRSCKASCIRFEWDSNKSASSSSACRDAKLARPSFEINKVGVDWDYFPQLILIWTFHYRVKVYRWGDTWASHVDFSGCLESGFQENTTSGFPRGFEVLAEDAHTWCQPEFHQCHPEGFHY
jgi:hypothetical protein